MSESIYTVVELTAKRNRLDELIAILTDLTEETRKESGCLEYSVIRDRNLENSLFSFERWEDEESESAHWRTPHVTNAISKMNPILENPPIIRKGRKVV